MRGLAICLLALSPVLADAQSRFAPDDADLLQQGLTATADDFILPAYTANAEAAGALDAAMRRYCAGDGDIEAARAAFARTFLAWQRASIIQIGPIMDAEGPMRVQLWPDPKGFARRAVRAALRQEDPALVADGGLDGRSIALTNLTALELLLWDVPPAPASYACDLARAISAFQAALAQAVAAAWTPGAPFRTEYDAAAAGNARYPTVDALIRRLLSGAIVYSDRLRKFKLLRGLGGAPGEARPERTEAAASGLGLQSIEASFRTLSALYDTPLGLFDIATDIGAATDFVVLSQTAANIADQISLETASLTEIAEEDGELAAELRTFAELVLFHETFLKEGFPGSIDLTAGFTAADGD